jgi:hypothetical protein
MVDDNVAVLVLWTLGLSLNMNGVRIVVEYPKAIGALGYNVCSWN